MTEWLLALVPTWGPWLLAACTYLACLALPVPASILLLAAGGFAAAGDLSLVAAISATLAAAFLGDQTMYAVGRRGGAGLLEEGGRRGGGSGSLGGSRLLAVPNGGVDHDGLNDSVCLGNVGTPVQGGSKSQRGHEGRSDDSRLHFDWCFGLYG